MAEEFDPMTLPDLDVVTINALDLFIEEGIPKLDLGNYSRPIILGSGNAFNTGKILFHDKDAVFADEGTVHEKLESIKNIDGAILISASGAKHAPIIAKELNEKQIETRLLTCNKDAPAKAVVGEDKTFVFPKRTEPYTYNVSTYLGMIFGKTQEDPAKLKEFIEKNIDPILESKSLDDFKAFFLLIPERFDAIKEMLVIKFDELFGPHIPNRVYTVEQTKHAKTVVPWDKELFLSFGKQNNHFGSPDARLDIPLPDDADFGAMMAIGYYVIGKIQKAKPPFFKESIVDYCKKTSEDFGSTIKPIVE